MYIVRRLSTLNKIRRVLGYFPMLDELLEALDKCVFIHTNVPPCRVILDLVVLPATCKQTCRRHMCVQVGLS